MYRWESILSLNEANIRAVCFTICDIWKFFGCLKVPAVATDLRLEDKILYFTGVRVN